MQRQWAGVGIAFALLLVLISGSNRPKQDWLTLRHITEIRNRLILAAGGDFEAYPPPIFHYREKPLGLVRADRTIAIKFNYNWSRKQLLFVLAHEVCHVELGHTRGLLPGKSRDMSQYDADLCAEELIRRVTQ